MDLDRAIAMDFLGARPVESARALERLRETEVARFLEGAETKDLAALLSALTPSVAAAQLALLPVEKVGAVLRLVGPERGASLARGLDAARREAVTAALPDEERAEVEKLLRYPAESAGALMDPRVASFHRSRRVSEVLEEFRERWRDLRYFVFVLDDEHRLAGVLSLRELVAAAPEARLDAVMRHPVVSLSARAGRAAILKHPGWRRFPQLPVVDESDRLLGVLRYRTFQSLREDGGAEEAPGALGLALALGELFWLGASGVFRGLAVGTDRRESGP